MDVRLGLLLGAKLYYNFHDDSDWDTKVATLTAAIGDRGKGTHTVVSSSAIAMPAPTANAITPKDWNADGLLQWMQSEGIENHHEAFVKHKIDSMEALLEFKNLLRDSSPLIASIFTLLNITQVGEILKITSALRKF